MSKKMKTFAKSSYSLELNSGHVNEAFGCSTVNPSLLSYQSTEKGNTKHKRRQDDGVNLVHPDGIGQWDQDCSCGASKGLDNPAVDLCVDDNADTDAGKVVVDLSRKAKTRLSDMKQLTPKEDQRTHTPARVANGQSVSGDLRKSQRLTSLWSGHRPLTTSVSNYLEQQQKQRPQQPISTRDRQCDDEDRPNMPTDASLNNVQRTEQLPPPHPTFTSPASTPDLRSIVSSCSLHIDSGLGSEATSVQGSMDQLINSDCFSLDMEQPEPFRQLEGSNSDEDPKFGENAVETSSVKDMEAETSQPPSDDDSGISGVTKNATKRGSDIIGLAQIEIPDREVLCHSPARDTQGDLFNTQTNNKSLKPTQRPASTLPPSPLSDSSRDRNKNHQKRKSTSASLKLPRESLCAKYRSCRWVLAYLCFLARFMQTALRQSLGIAIIGMTLKMTERVVTPDAGWNAWDASMTRNNSSNNNISSNSNSNKEPVFNNLVRNGSTLKWTDENGFNWTMVVTSHSEFHWSSVFEGIVLASFSAGSLITPIIVGYLTCRYGGRKLMTACLLAGGMFTGLLPVAATTHPALIIVFRVITGVSLSGTDSMIQAMWARWAPKFEKASLTSVGYTGTSVAGSVTYLICGYLASIGGEGRGWPYIFYILGCLCVLLAPLWWYCVHDTPEVHPRMTTTELVIITSNRKAQETTLIKAPLNPPWKKILSSPAVWVILVGHISNKWITSFMMSYMPRFVADLFHYDMQTIHNGTVQAMQPAQPPSVGTMEGLFASLPFMGRIVSGIVAAMVSDWMLRMGVSTSTTRKTFQALGNWSCGLCTLFLAFIPMNPALSMGFLVLALTMQNLTSVAYKINLLDIAPRYAGLLNGVMSTVSTLASLPAPVITSLLVADGSGQGWQAVFCMVAGLTSFGGLIFILFAQGEVQDWAVAPSKTTPTDLEVEADTTSGRRRRNFGHESDVADDHKAALAPVTLYPCDLSAWNLSHQKVDNHVTQHRLRWSLGKALDENLRSRLFSINLFACHGITERPGLETSAGTGQSDDTGADPKKLTSCDLTECLDGSHDQSVGASDIGQLGVGEDRLFAALQRIQASEADRSSETDDSEALDSSGDTGLNSYYSSQRILAQRRGTYPCQPDNVLTSGKLRSRRGSRLTKCVE